MTSRIIISLTDNEVNLLRKELHGIGGFQSLIASQWTKLHGSDLELDFADVEKLLTTGAM